MAVPDDVKEQAIYHTMLGDMHRVHATLLNLRTLTDPYTAEGLREHFRREQGLILARLSEWRGRRPDIYREAQADFAEQVRSEPASSPATE